MDFIRRRRRLPNPEESELAELYPHDLQIYTSPPVCEVSLTEFEKLAVDRLSVLRIIEQINSHGHSKNSEEWTKAVADEIKKHSNLKSFHKLITGLGLRNKEPDFAARKADHISHFVLRLAFCRTEELRRWFISRELDLFRLRWLHLTNEGKSEFIRLNHLSYHPISPSERQEMSEKSCGLVSSAADYFCVPFTQVLDLVRSRKVFLHSGSAYITSSDIISVLLSTYRTQLSQELARMARLFPLLEAIEEDQDRIIRPLMALPHAYIGEDYSRKKSGNKIPIECIDSLARQSFPLCMRQLHAKLRQDHKLKHHGRLQYCLFLKGIGVTLEDILTMWREEWSKSEPEKFEKGGVAYLLRHSYGKEGKRTDYTPQGCVKIINSSVGTGDQHGCPFKHNDVSSIRLILSQNNTSATDIQETVDLINRGQYQMACTKYFEITHGMPPEKFINHPNQYFEESQKARSGKSLMKNRELPGEKVASTFENPKDEMCEDFTDAELMSIDVQ